MGKGRMAGYAPVRENKDAATDENDDAVYNRASQVFEGDRCTYDQLRFTGLGQFTTIYF